LTLDLRSLIGKLNDTSRRALEGAAGLALSRTHFDVEVEHWLTKLLEDAESDVPRICRKFDVDPDRLAQQLEGVLDQMKSGNGRRPDLSPEIESLTREAWVWSSVQFDLSRIRSGAIFLAMMSDERIRRRLRVAAPELSRVSVEKLESDLDQVAAGSKEALESAPASSTVRREVGGTASSSGEATPALDKYTRDLTSEAEASAKDPVIARESEIRQLIDILGRRRQNNPIITGEAGVGKTAVVEGFAQRIAAGEVPDSLANVRVKELDMGLLQAGAGVKGEFENRLKQVIQEVQSSPVPIILFIDEIHTMVGAGGAEGTNDAANLLKPALARGEMRTIGATTWAEYKKHIEKDPALTRRFNVVKVDEPDEEMAIRMMRGVASTFETHHDVRIRDEALVESVRLSHRYIPARQLPDKAISVLDTACARVALGDRVVPAPIEDLRAQKRALEVEVSLLEREDAAGADHAERRAEIAEEMATVETSLESLEQRWEEEKELIGRVRALRDAAGAQVQANAEAEEGDAPSPTEPAASREEIDALEAELDRVQGDDPLMLLDVDGQAIAGIVSSWTGIPVRKMVADEILGLLRLSDRLRERVVGQDHGLDAIASRIHTSKASLDNPNKPIGVFLLLGPSGVGKTETAMALAESLYGGEQNAVVINMSEYQEAHTVSSLKGAPPGYVGYGEGGVLTEAVRRRPYSVVLLDEVEKAHPDVMEVFFQVFDKGVLEDGEGREIDFKNTIIILTSNVGSDTITSLCDDPETMPAAEALAKATRKELLDVFPAALLGRLVTVPYYPVSGDILRRIVELKLDHIVNRVRENHRAEMTYDDRVVELVIERCTESESGARAVDNILTNSMLPQMSAEVLSRMASGTPFSKVNVELEEPGAFRFRFA
jgi:type VI secretion system protein VasG